MNVGQLCLPGLHPASDRVVEARAVPLRQAGQDLSVVESLPVRNRVGVLRQPSVQVGRGAGDLLSKPDRCGIILGMGRLVCRHGPTGLSAWAALASVGAPEEGKTDSV